MGYANIVIEVPIEKIDEAFRSLIMDRIKFIVEMYGEYYNVDEMMNHLHDLDTELDAYAITIDDEESEMIIPLARVWTYIEENKDRYKRIVDSCLHTYSKFTQ